MERLPVKKINIISYKKSGQFLVIFRWFGKFECILLTKYIFIEDFF